jgi:hypothetical protein
MDRLRRWLREFGLRITLLYALHRLLQAASGGRWRVVPYRFYAQPIGRAGTPALRPDSTTWIGPLTPGHPLVPALPRPPSVIAARFAAGSRCYAATVKNNFAGTIWLARGHYDEDEVRCRYQLTDVAASAWDYDVYVAPAFRLGRTMARLWQHVDTLLAAEGVRWSFSRISMFNPASIASHARLGARPVGWAVFLCLGGLQLAVASTRPRIDLGLRGRPCYRLHPPPQTSPM